MAKILLGKTIKKLISERKISIRALAKQTGIPQSTLNSISNGREPGKVEHLLTLSKYFKVSMEYLLTGNDDQPPTLENVLTEDIFAGWLRVKIERAIPDKKREGNK